jgi:argininosuccinate lyase
MVRRLLSEKRDFESLSLDEWQRDSHLFGADVKDHVTAAASVKVRKTPQSTNPDAVRAALHETREWLARSESL